MKKTITDFINDRPSAVLCTLAAQSKVVTACNSGVWAIFVSGSTSVAFGNMATYTQNASNWVAVPEPTSGLLMLLGMAGLALRRRRS